MGLNEIISEALTLKPQERYQIIENLVLSLNQPNLAIDKLWIEESQKRLQAIKEGKLKTVSYQDVFAS
ncbi:addiction module protein [Sulfurovum sp. bin170]|uniref:addiction module protein n=1 Tax=Sulfurovum sp. bin170 TaxID=2695268 RepID=UPI0013DFC7C2|nr:addiction module protein [Sulfurovum sp. bin170]NEW59883.1 addiction module protein [Sulfurovum sp. bin170]